MDTASIFASTIRRHRMIAPGDRVLAAVSGGGDSVALLHLLLAYRRSPGAAPFELAVAHLDHGVRGAAAREDRRFVGALAGDSGLEVIDGSCEPSTGPSEADLRAARLAFLRRSANRWRASRIAMGHTRDDQAETVLLNLLRGAGGRGLSGMPAVRPFADSEASLIRPLLHNGREELRAWLRERQLGWRTDATNDDDRYLRNRVRHELMPLLESLRPGAGRTIARAARTLAGDETVLEEITTRAAADVDWDGDTGRLRAAGLAALPEPIRRRLLRRVAGEAGARAGLEAREGAAPWSPTSLQIDAVLDLLLRDGSGQVDLGRGMIARVHAGELELRGPGLVPPPLPPAPVSLPVPGEARFGGHGRLTARRLPPGSSRPEVAGNILGGLAVYLDETALSAPLLLRARQSGDRFRPLGGRGSRSVAAFLADRKVPRWQRDEVPILCCGDDIAWIVGYRLDGKFAAGADCRQVVEIRWEQGS